MSAIHTTVAGRLATTPERYESERGTRATFRVASTERRYNRAAESWSDAETVYLSVTCWRQLADNVARSLRVGDPVVVHGKLVSRSYERDGRTLSLMEISADAVGPDLRWSTASVTRTRSAPAEAPLGAPVEAPREAGPVPAARGAEHVVDDHGSVDEMTGPVEVPVETGVGAR